MNSVVSFFALGRIADKENIRYYPYSFLGRVREGILWLQRIPSRHIFRISPPFLEGADGIRSFRNAASDAFRAERQDQSSSDALPRRGVARGQP